MKCQLFQWIQIFYCQILIFVTSFFLAMKLGSLQNITMGGWDSIQIVNKGLNCVLKQLYYCNFADDNYNKTFNVTINNQLFSNCVEMFVLWVCLLVKWTFWVSYTGPGLAGGAVWAWEAGSLSTLGPPPPPPALVQLSGLPLYFSHSLVSLSVLYG